MTDLVQVQKLRVQFKAENGEAVQAVCGASFEVKQGEIIGILGESGCGKSTLARAMVGLLPSNGKILAGEIKYSEESAKSASTSGNRSPRRAVLVSQDPGIALNPVLRVGDQIAEVVRAHNTWDKKKCREAAKQLLCDVQLHADPKLYHAYPHQISGGQQQRVVIAQALACKPALLIADEPTASLDASTEAGILNLLRASVAQRRMALLLVTHNPRILMGLAQRVLVMYGGRIVEEGLVKDVFQEPLHPYTKGLLSCLRNDLSREETSQGARFSTIEGNSPVFKEIHAGCSFAPRCKERVDTCAENDPCQVRVGTARSVECMLYAD